MTGIDDGALQWIMRPMLLLSESLVHRNLRQRLRYLMLLLMVMQGLVVTSINLSLEPLRSKGRSASPLAHLAINTWACS